MKKPALDSFPHPEAVAVVGASSKEGTIGHTLVHNLRQDGFPGSIDPINPKYEEIL